MAMANSPCEDQDLFDREQKLREKLEEERVSYKTAVELLKQLKTEIEHLHHLHTAQRAKLQKEFEQNAYLEQTGVTERPEQQTFVQRQLTSTIENPRTIHPIESPSQPANPVQQRPDLNITMTGDGEVDENIAAFLRARQALMARAAANTRNYDD